MLISFLLLAITTYGQTSNNWKTLDQPNYIIQYPSTWELNQNGQMGTSFFLFSALESDKDKFKENINLIIQDLSGLQIDLNKYIEITEGQIKTIVTNSNLIESKRMSNGNAEFHKIIYSGDQGVFQLKFEQYYWVVNNKAFVLTFTSEKDKYANFVETAEKILNSFVLKK